MNHSFFCVFGVSSIMVMIAFTEGQTSFETQKLLRPPFRFGYHWGGYLNVWVRFINLSPGVVYKVYQADKSLPVEKKQLKSKSGNLAYYTMQKTLLDSRIYIELKTNDTRCRNITILEGIAVSSNQIAVPQFAYNNMCLKANSYCTIEVDIKRDCKDGIQMPKKPPPESTGQSKQPPSGGSGQSKQRPSKVTGQSKNPPSKSTDLSKQPPSISTGQSSQPPSKSDGQSIPSPSERTGQSKQRPSQDSGQSKLPPSNSTGQSKQRPLEDTGKSKQQPSESTDQSKQQPSEDTGQSKQLPQNVVLIYVAASATVVCVLVLVTCISVKRYRRPNSHPEDTTELNTYATANDVVYADLRLVHKDSQPPRRDEESQYAKIIGVLKTYY